MKKEIGQRTKDTFEILLISSKSKPNSASTDNGKEFVSKNFREFFQLKNDEKFQKRAVFAEKFKGTNGNLLEKLVFEVGSTGKTNKVQIEIIIIMQNIEQ